MLSNFVFKKLFFSITIVVTRNTLYEHETSKFISVEMLTGTLLEASRKSYYLRYDMSSWTLTLETPFQ